MPAPSTAVRPLLCSALPLITVIHVAECTTPEFPFVFVMSLSQDKDILEKISSTVAMGAVLDQKQRSTAFVQVEHLRRVLSESLHQVTAINMRHDSGTVVAGCVFSV